MIVVIMVIVMIIVVIKVIIVRHRQRRGRGRGGHAGQADCERIENRLIHVLIPIPIPKT